VRILLLQHTQASSKTGLGLWWMLFRQEWCCSRAGNCQ